MSVYQSDYDIMIWGNGSKGQEVQSLNRELKNDLERFGSGTRVS